MATAQIVCVAVGAREWASQQGPNANVRNSNSRYYLPTCKTDTAPGHGYGTTWEVVGRWLHSSVVVPRYALTNLAVKEIRALHLGQIQEVSGRQTERMDERST